MREDEEDAEDAEDQPLQLRAPQSTASTALPQAFAPAPSQQFKPFHLSSSSIVLIKVVMVKKVERDGFLKFAIVCKHAKQPI